MSAHAETSAGPTEGRVRTQTPTSPRGLFLTLLALLVLAGFSLAMRFAHLGAFGFAVGLGVAAIKAALVAVFFMEILSERATVRFAFVTCLSLFALLVMLTVADVLTRAVPPLDNPPGTAPRAAG
jgi:cytochrome c oxidase subunit 4